MKRPGLEETIEILKGIERPTIVDVGAYTGKIFRLAHEAGITFDGYAIEPDPTNYALLEENLKNLPRMHFYNCAISDTFNKVILYVTDRPQCEGTSQSNTLWKKALKSKMKKGKIDNIKEVEVQAFTMAQFINMNNIEKIDFLKINCEGGEYCMFDNPKFLDITDMILVSLHAQASPFTKPQYEVKRKVINKMLVSLGFKMIAGDPLTKNKKHYWQLWRKDGDG